MLNTRDYYREIRAIAARFDPEALQRDRGEEDVERRTHLKLSEMPVWLTSIENRATGSVGGSTLLMKPYAAAERIFAQTHREATAEEISREEARLAEARVQILKDEAERKQTVTTHITMDSQGIVDGVVAAMGNQKPARSPKGEQAATQGAARSD